MSLENKAHQQQIVNDIVDKLSHQNIYSTIEILANVFLTIGINQTDIDPEQVNSKTIYEHILRDIKNNGDTLGNSLLRQGLMILDWLNEGKK